MTVACVLLGIAALFMTGRWLGARELYEDARIDRDFWRQMYRNERSHTEELLQIEVESRTGPEVGR
jgi:hypothetical protein